MSQHIKNTMQRHRMPPKVRWSAAGIVKMKLEGEDMIIGVLTNDTTGPRVQRAFVEVRVPLRAKLLDIRRLVDEGLLKLQAESKRSSVA